MQVVLAGEQLANLLLVIPCLANFTSQAGMFKKSITPTCTLTLNCVLFFIHSGPFKNLIIHFLCVVLEIEILLSVFILVTSSSSTMVKNSHQEDANPLGKLVKVSELTSNGFMSALSPSKRTITSTKLNTQVALSPSLLGSPRKHKLETTSPKKTPTKKRTAPLANRLSLVAADSLEETQKILRLRISQVNQPPVISGYERERK